MDTPGIDICFVVDYQFADQLKVSMGGCGMQRGFPIMPTDIHMCHCHGESVLYNDALAPMR